VELYNIGSFDQISVIEIAKKVVHAMGNQAHIEFTGGDRGWVGDIPKQFLMTGKIRATGWRPRYTSAEAVDRTIPLVRAQLGF
jgi:UDP-glucose 4-epimerase